MSRTSAALTALLVASLVAGCAGPAPSGSSPSGGETPQPSPAVGASMTLAPTVEPTSSPTLAPTAEPTFEPEPTVPGALPLRTEVEVNSPIVDRPGVPADLYGTYWWTEYGDAGQLGTTAQIGLPANEQILAAASHLVVSARKSTDDYYSRADLLVRDIRTGELVAEIATTVGDPVAALIGNRLFWAGVDPSSDGENRVIDGGVWTMSLAGGSESVAIVPPGDDITTLVAAGRVRFQLSPSGGTIASTVGGFSGRFTDIIDVKTLTLRTRLDGEAVFTLNDEVAIATDEPPTDAPRGWIKAIDLDAGSTPWRFPTLGQREDFGVEAIQASGSTFVGQFNRQPSGDSVVALFDPLTGDRRRLLLQAAGGPSDSVLILIRSLTGAQHAAMATYGSTSDLLFERGVAGSILDLKTGELVRDAFVLDTPWLCHREYCLRD